MVKTDSQGEAFIVRERQDRNANDDRGRTHDGILMVNLKVDRSLQTEVKLVTSV